MPTEPAVESVMANVKSTLDGITQRAGYWNTIREVFRSPETLPEGVAHPFIAVFMEGSPIEVQTNVEDLETMNVHIDAWDQVSDADNLERDALRLRQDIEKALMTDHTRGGNAQSTHMRRYDVIYVNDVQGSYCGVTMDWEIVVRYTRGTP
jgi:hypothetical protein